MACSYPRLAFRTDDNRLTFKDYGRDARGSVSSMWLPCNRCELCMLKRKSELSLRLQHEAYSHPDSFALTATYDPEHLPAHGSVSERDYFLFRKQLVNLGRRTYGRKIVVHGVSEYSPRMRPHYHVLVFGFVPDDAKHYSRSQAGNLEYTSEQLSKAWGHRGLLTFQLFSPGAANYVAGHQSSKLKHKSAPELVVHTPQGTFHREPEFESRPKRPALGDAFCLKYADQLLGQLFTVDSARNKRPLPSRYIDLLEQIDPHRIGQFKAEQAVIALKQAEHNSYARLAVREEFAQLERQRYTRTGLD